MGICDGRVVIVTGGGRGLGRAHCLAFAAEGAKVVVNDLGASLQGDATDESPGAEVVNEITAAGGEAVVNGDDVSDWDGAGRLVEQAIETFGGLDTVVCNAGIVRDRMLVNMSVDEWDAVIRVHLRGVFCPIRHAIGYWREEQKAERPRDARIVTTSSGAGLRGSIAQSNYVAAKAGIAGLSSAVALEGAAHGIRSNVVAPVAVTRIAAGMRPDDISETDLALASRGDLDVELPTAPEFVTPMVVYLASEACDFTQRIYSAASGRFARVFVAATRGWYGPLDRPASVEDIAAHLDQIDDRSEYQIPTTVFDEAGGIREWYPASRTSRD